MTAPIDTNSFGYQASDPGKAAQPGRRRRRHRDGDG